MRVRVLPPQRSALRPWQHAVDLWRNLGQVHSIFETLRQCPEPVAARSTQQCSLLRSHRSRYNKLRGFIRFGIVSLPALR